MSSQATSLHWKSWKIYTSGDDYFADLIYEIRRAEKIITFEVYIFELDSLTQMILEELSQAQRRGCEVYILVDGFGSYFWLRSLEAFCKQKKLKFRIFHPLPRSYKWFKTSLIRYLFRMIKILRRFNHRNHRKIFIIDKSVAFLGSLNLTQVHSEKLMGSEAWQDLGLQVSGGSLPDLVNTFWVAWRRAHKIGLKSILQRRTRDKNYQWNQSLVRLNATTWSRYALYRDLIRRIKKSKKNIWITSAYFLPKRSLLRALQKAAKRGVEIQIIIPSRTDVPLVKWAAEGLIEKLTKNGVKIYEFIPRVLHSKYLIIDDWAAIGSHNWNHRSFLHDLEVEAVLTDPKAIEQIQQIWMENRENSFRITLEEIKSKSWLRRWISRLAFRLRYLL